jgi:hypothetical protein
MRNLAASRAREKCDTVTRWRASLDHPEREAVPQPERERIAVGQVENRRVVNHDQLIALEQRADVAQAQQGPAARRARQRPLFPQRAAQVRRRLRARAGRQRGRVVIGRHDQRRRIVGDPRELAGQLVRGALHARHALGREFSVDDEAARARGMRCRTDAPLRAGVLQHGPVALPNRR